MVDVVSITVDAVPDAPEDPPEPTVIFSGKTEAPKLLADFINEPEPPPPPPTDPPPPPATAKNLTRMGNVAQVGPGQVVELVNSIDP